MIELICAVCGKTFKRKPYEVKRNAELGRTNLCSRKCQATWMNKSDAKQTQTREMLADRNSHQYRDANPNWKGGISHKLKPLPSLRCPNCNGPAMCEGPVSFESDYYCPGCNTHFSEEEAVSGEADK